MKRTTMTAMILLLILPALAAHRAPRPTPVRSSHLYVDDVLPEVVEDVYITTEVPAQGCDGVQLAACHDACTGAWRHQQFGMLLIEVSCDARDDTHARCRCRFADTRVVA
jgi:hypothetical protein